MGQRAMGQPISSHAKSIRFAYAFFNSALIGATWVAVVSLVPPLHRAFSKSMEAGGFLNAWFTSSLSNIGQLFVSL
jgi:hypothetical protein